MDRIFQVKRGTEYSGFRQISARVPQGSVLGSILYLLYTRDIPISEEMEMATFIDGTAVMVRL